MRITAAVAARHSCARTRKSKPAINIKGGPANRAAFLYPTRVVGYQLYADPSSTRAALV
jgi:hypothetical protein